MTDMMKFDLPKQSSSIIKVIGVGGGGSNAVNHMYNQGIHGVDFVVCNTDRQALEISPVPLKIQLGEGLGAGSIPEVGRQAAVSNIECIREILGGETRMAFITAGMGGGTGTGAAPVVAATAREMGILTVGIVTIPFAFEGKKRRIQADEGIRELKDNVDALLIISNEKLRQIHGNLTLKNAFAHADNVLTTAAKGIAEIITVTGMMNVDFNDVQTVMYKGGAAIMGYATAEGEGRALEAVEKALSCPLLNDNDISGATQVLLYIMSSSDDAKQVTMDEIGEISDYIQSAAGSTANIILGAGHDEALDDKVSVIVIATGFNNKLPDVGIDLSIPAEKKVMILEEVKKETRFVEPEPTKKQEDFGIRVYTLPETNTVAATLPAEPVYQQVVEPVVQQQAATIQQIAVAQQVAATPQIVEQPQIAEIAAEPTIVHSLQMERQTVVEATNPYMPTMQSAPAVQTMAATSTMVMDQTSTGSEGNQQVQEEELKAKQQDRINRLKMMTNGLKNRGGMSISEMENVPAFERRGVQLASTTPSSESHVSRYTLSNQDGRFDFRENNSYLHDNVD